MKRFAVILGALLLFPAHADSKKEANKQVKKPAIYVDKSFSENLKKMRFPDSVKLPEIVLGSSNAIQHFTVWMSFTCPICKDFFYKEFPKVEKYILNGEVSLRFKCYLDDLGSLEAAILMRGFGRNADEVRKIYTIILNNQDNWLKSSKPREFLKKLFIDNGYNKRNVEELCNPNSAAYKKLAAGLMKDMQDAIQGEISVVPTIIYDNEKIKVEGYRTAEEIGKGSKKRSPK